MLILFIVEVGSSSAGVVKNIASSGGKSEVRPKLYINVIFLHDFDEK